MNLAAAQVSGKRARVFIFVLHVFDPSVDPQAAPEKRLEDMMRLGELCIEVLQQNDEHHSEVFSF